MIFRTTCTVKLHLEITVIGTHETVVCNVWKELHNESSTSVPHIETKRTVNSTWFDYNTGCADTEVNIEHEEPDVENISTIFSSLLIKVPNEGAVDMLRQWRRCQATGPSIESSFWASIISIKTRRSYLLFPIE